MVVSTRSFFHVLEKWLKENLTTLVIPKKLTQNSRNLKKIDPALMRLYSKPHYCWSITCILGAYPGWDDIAQKAKISNNKLIRPSTTLCLSKEALWFFVAWSGNVLSYNFTTLFFQFIRRKLHKNVNRTLIDKFALVIYLAYRHLVMRWGWLMEQWCILEVFVDM